MSPLTSTPEQNPRPTPVSTITRTLGSSSPARMYSPTLTTVLFSSVVPTTAFRRSGRFSLIQRMPDSSTS